jgi:hypothetical protein
MDADEIVIEELMRQRVAVILDLFREGVRQPREAAHAHPHIEVLALDIRGRDMRVIRAPIVPETA